MQRLVGALVALAFAAAAHSSAPQQMLLVGSAASGPAANSWNPSDKAANLTLSNNNYTGSAASNTQGGARSVVPLVDGQYFEVRVDARCNSTAPERYWIGVANTSANLTSLTADANRWVIRGDGQKENSTASAYGSSFTTDDVISVAYKGGKVWMAKNGVWANSGDPAAGTNAAFTGLANGLYAYWMAQGNANGPLPMYGTGRFTNRQVQYTVPTGFSVVNETPVYTASTFNPSDKNANITLSNGNLTASNTTNFWHAVRTTAPLSDGQYFEVVVDSDPSANFNVTFGVGLAQASLADGAFAGTDWFGWSMFGSGGTKFHAASTQNGTTAVNGAAYGATNVTAGDVVGIAYKGGKIWWAKNNVWMNSGDPAAGTGEAFDKLPTTGLYPMIGLHGNKQVTIRMSSASFTYSPPAGFSAPP